MNRHYWYYRFLADVDWLNDFIADIEDYWKAFLIELTRTAGVASGMNVSERGQGQNFSVDVSSGSAYDVYGRRIVASGTINVPFDDDANGDNIECVGANKTRIVSVYAYYKMADSGPVVDGNGATVNTVGTESVQFKLYQGAIANLGLATPPANPNNGGILLANVLISTGDLTIANADIDNTVKNIWQISVGSGAIKDTDIDWGTGGGQVNAADIPIIDGGNHFVATDVEGALAALAASVIVHTHLDNSNGGTLTAAAIAAGTFADARIAQSNVTQHQSALAIAASQITSGTLPDARVAQSNVTQHQAALTLAASQITSGTLTDARVAQSNVTQHQAALTLAASQITSGTLPDARVAQSNVTQHQAALALAASQITSGTFTDARVAQSNVTQHQSALALAASQITSGTLPVGRGGTGTTTSTGSGSVVLSNNPTFGGGQNMASDGSILTPAVRTASTTSYFSRTNVIRNWVMFDDSGNDIEMSVNCSSVGDNDGDGNYTVTWSVGLSSQVGVGHPSAHAVFAAAINSQTDLGSALASNAFDVNVWFWGTFTNAYEDVTAFFVGSLSDN